MIDHGDQAGNFYIGDEVLEYVTPQIWSDWLDGLEAGLTDLTKPRVIMLGYCFSGQTLAALAKPGRLIISSAAADEESYKGPKEPDGIRGGEYFMEAFFHNLKRGDSFLAAFQEATVRTEMLTRRGSRGANSVLNEYGDLSVQHPLLALDGDQGRNVLGRIPKEKRTAIKIEELYLGAGADYDTNYAGNPADIISVADTIYLEPSESAADLYLTVNEVLRVKEAAVNVRLPDTELEKTEGQRAGYAEQREISELVEVNLLCDFSQRCQRNTDDVVPNLFSEPGKYDLYYFVSDNENHDISPVWRSVVYKQKVDNAAPDSFNLHYPQDGSEQATRLVLNWQATSDPNDDPVTYRLLIAEEFKFERIVYQVSDLYQTAVALGPNLPLSNGTTGLQDASQYYWKVEAIDQYGAITTSDDVFSFKTDNTNAPPWIGSQYVSSAVNFISLDQVDMSFWQTDAFGMLVLDEFGYPKAK